MLCFGERSRLNTNKSKKLLNIPIYMEKFDYVFLDQQWNIDKTRLWAYRKDLNCMPIIFPLYLKRPVWKRLEC